MKFFPLIEKAFVNIVNSCFDAGKLTESQRHDRYGLSSLLCKKPISLLNVDYKIISK